MALGSTSTCVFYQGLRQLLEAGHRGQREAKFYYSDGPPLKGPLSHLGNTLQELILKTIVWLNEELYGLLNTSMPLLHTLVISIPPSTGPPTLKLTPEIASLTISYAICEHHERPNTLIYRWEHPFISRMSLSLIWSARELFTSSKN